MTPAAAIDVDASIPGQAQIRELDWITETIAGTDIGERTDLESGGAGDRLASARGALLGINLGAILWAAVLALIVWHL